MPMNPDAHVELRLAGINHRLSRLLGRDELPLATGGELSLRDRLWVWGILGGKDVGKSTLINALAGAEVVPRGLDVGEGTFQPAAYLSAADEEALRTRFAELTGINVAYHAEAPASMRGLVLVDLPDFDSLFTRHLEQVRRVVRLLDGIIWVTTPKKVGDLRAIREIEGVLKARTNFIYVVNKIDWLLGQSAGSARGELERMTSALQAQVSACEPGEGLNGTARSFLISAKYRTPQAILEEVGRSRNGGGTAAARGAGDGAELRVAAERLASDFEALRQALTTAPTPQAAAINKQANLEYQVRSQARRMLEYYQPQDILQRLRSVVGPDTMEEITAAAFPAAYSQRLVQALGGGRALLAHWPAELFRRRIAYWPMLGLIAWPLALLGAAVAGLRRLLPRSAAAEVEDPFRLDGLALEDRVEGLLAAARTRLASASPEVAIDLPDAAALARQFRSDARTVSEARQAAAIAPFARRRPTWLGRVVRAVLPVAVVLWFPLVQPLLSALLSAWETGVKLDLAAARMLVSVLSAGQVLEGLVVSLLILAALAAAVYSGAVRDSFTAMERLERSDVEGVAEPLAGAIAARVSRPVEQVCQQLSELSTALEDLAEK